MATRPTRAWKTSRRSFAWPASSREQHFYIMSSGISCLKITRVKCVLALFVLDFDLGKIDSHGIGSQGRKVVTNVPTRHDLWHQEQSFKVLRQNISWPSLTACVCGASITLPGLLFGKQVLVFGTNSWTNGKKFFIKQSKQIFGIMLLPIVSLPHLWSQQTKFGSFHRRRSWARSQQDKFGRLRWRSSMPSKSFPPKSTHHANDLLHAASSILGHKRKFLMLCPSTRSTSMLSELMSLTWTSCGVVPLAKVPVQDLIKSGSGALLYPAG